MKKIKVLFVCIHNSARSQMAEAFLNLLGQGKFEAESAGIEPGKLNPFVVSVMKEDGIDISDKNTKSVNNFLNKEFDYVITVCDETIGERCPIFSAKTKKLHWNFEDPSSFIGNDEDKFKFTREIKNKIKTKIENWISNFNNKKKE